LDEAVGRSASLAASQVASAMADQIVGQIHSALAEVHAALDARGAAHAAALDGHLTQHLAAGLTELREHVDARTGQVQAEQHEDFRRLLAEVHAALDARGAAHAAALDGHLTQHLAASLTELREHVDARTGQVQAEQHEDFRRLLAAGLTELREHVDARTGQVQAEQHEDFRRLLAAGLTELREHVDARTGQVQAEQHEGFRKLLSGAHAAQIAEMRAATADLIAAEGATLRQDLHRQLSHVDAQIAEMRAATAVLIADANATLRQDLHQQLSHVDAHLSSHLTKELSLHLGSQGGVVQLGQNTALLQKRLVTLARLLEPTSATGIAKRRMGHSGDGGYVMLDDFEEVRFALSLGVGAEMTWDIEMANLGIEVHQFDYTIEMPPEAHENIHFHQSRIAPMQANKDHSLASAQALGGNGLCIIKIDIEGDEWSVLEAAADHDFDRVTQLIVEFHDFDRAGQDEWYDRAERVLQRLATNFRVVHVHANNNGALTVRGNVAFPEILEVTFGNKSRYAFEPCAETFPTPLDAPNRDDLPDIMLGAFRF